MRTSNLLRLVVASVVAIIAIALNNWLNPVWNYGNAGCWFFLSLIFAIATVGFGIVENKAKDGYIACTLLSLSLSSANMSIAIIVKVIHLIKRAFF